MKSPWKITLFSIASLPVSIPTGTGKTLMAKALAGESGVPLLGSSNQNRPYEIWAQYGPNVGLIWVYMG